MIDEIQVRNLALIREAELEPCAGLTVLTGETGAGKTALLSALKLLMGARASADLVRDGEERLVVSGRFLGRFKADGQGEDGAADGGARGDQGEAGAAGAPAATFAGESADDQDDAPDELVVTRKVGADGRSRASVNGNMASIRELSELVAPTVDLCGQFEHQQLMRPPTHVGLLDAWAEDEVAPVLEEYRRAFDAAAEASSELSRVREAGSLSAAKLEDARFTLRRINEVAPAEGEYEELKRDLARAEHAEALATAVSGAHDALSGDGAALDSLNAAAAALESAAQMDEGLSPLADSLREAGYVLEDVAAQARDYRDQVDFDAETLAQQQERFSQMQGLLRAYGPRMEDVLARQAEAAELVSLVDDSEARLRAAEKRASEAEAALAEAADTLDAARDVAAPQFAREVSAVMARLEMGSAELVCEQRRLARESWTRTGPSSFEFLYRATAGMQPRPLARIASGGEVSRVMLAVKVVLGAHDDVDTLVFDEVDAGVGGSTAVALAEVIAELARTHQVIVVTHLAQVAVRGDAHYVVVRQDDETRLLKVAGPEREREVARMLSGSTTETSLAHARELLAGAQGCEPVGEFGADDAPETSDEADAPAAPEQLELDVTSQVLNAKADKRVIFKA